MKPCFRLRLFAFALALLFTLSFHFAFASSPFPTNTSVNLKLERSDSVNLKPDYPIVTDSCNTSLPALLSETERWKLASLPKISPLIQSIRVVGVIPIKLKPLPIGSDTSGYLPTTTKPTILKFKNTVPAQKGVVK